MHSIDFSDLLLNIEIYTVRVCEAILFVVFVVVGTKHAISHILRLGRGDK